MSLSSMMYPSDRQEANDGFNAEHFFDQYCVVASMVTLQALSFEELAKLASVVEDRLATMPLPPKDLPIRNPASGVLIFGDRMKDVDLLEAAFSGIKDELALREACDKQIPENVKSIIASARHAIVARYATFNAIQVVHADQIGYTNSFIEKCRADCNNLN